MSASPPAQRAPVRQVLWLAQLSSACVFAALAWWLPEIVSIPPAHGVTGPLLAAGIASVPAAILIVRLLRARQSRRTVGGDPKLPMDAAPAPTPPAEHAGYLVALAVAELPAILGLVYALLGGVRLHGVALAIASVLLLLTLWPNAPGRSRQDG